MDDYEIEGDGIQPLTPSNLQEIASCILEVKCPHGTLIRMSFTELWAMKNLGGTERITLNSPITIQIK